MHLRKTRKAKAAASEFVRRVISGKDVSPDRRDLSASRATKATKPATSRQASKGSTSSRAKSPSRGRPSSPRSTTTRSGQGATTRATSRSPSRARDVKTKPTKTEPPPPGKSPRRGRPPKNPKPQPRSASPAQAAAKPTKAQSVTPPVKPGENIKEEVPEKTIEKKSQPKSNSASPVAKTVPSVKGKQTAGLLTKNSSGTPKKGQVENKPSEEKDTNIVETGESELAIIPPDEIKTERVTPPSPAIEEVAQSKQVITPRIVFVDQPSDGGGTPTGSPGRPPCSPIATLRASPQQFKSMSPIKISPTAKLIPVSSLSNINTAGKSLFTISIPGSSLPKTVGQGAQFIVSAQPVGSLSPSPIKVTASTSSGSPGQVTLDLVELAKSMTALTPQRHLLPDSVTADLTTHSPPINKSPKLLLSATKQSEGKIKKRKRPKIPDWEVPSAVYQSKFDEPQPKFERKDGEICYPETAQMEQSDYFRIVGIINKADIKKSDGTEHRNHRLAGGKLRRVCKPKISPEMVYRRFSLARGCIMHDVYVDSDEEGSADSQSPRVADKHAIIKTEYSKKGSLSPRIHDSYRQHCIKIPLITIEKVGKEGSSSEGENSPSKLTKVNSLKENEPPYGGAKGDWECGEGSSGGTPKAKRKENPSHKKSFQPSKSSKPGAKKQLDTKKMGGKTLEKSKSFEGSFKKGGKTTSLAKSKSFERYSTLSKAEISKSRYPPPKVKTEPELDDGSTRRSARNRGAKRKQWWHLLRANPDEFEEDKEWEREVALQEQKRKARIERARDRDDSDDEEEEEEEGEVEEIEPKKTTKKKAKVKKEPDGEGDGVDPKSYTDLYESKLKNKKKRSKDWALAKKVLEEARAEAKAKEEGAKSKAGSKGSRKEGTKRKAGECSGTESPVKRIKTEPASAPCSDDEGAGDKRGKLKKKKSSSALDQEEQVDEKPTIITNLIILGEDGEPLQAKENSAIYDQLQSLLEGKEAEKLARTGVLELTIPPDSPQSFIEILAREQQKLRPQSPYNMLPIVRSDVLYKTKEAECIAPHMCSVCWINDHMYCRNMKRIARDLPLCGGCIHYVPCHHYRQKESPSAIDRKHIQRRVRRSLYATIDHADGSSKTVIPVSSHTSGGSPFTSPAARKINFSTDDISLGRAAHSDDLLCDESLTESDSEPNSPEAPPPPGTELLKAELRARASQIKKALGYKSLPKTISPLKRTLQWASPGRVVDLTGQGEDTTVEDEEDHSEVVINDYAQEETVGKEPVEVVDYGVPLTEEFLIKEGETKKEGWRTNTSIFMPNTESDASNDSHDIPMHHMGMHTACDNNYEESIFGENSQDSTETSMSQISTHVESDDSDAEGITSEPHLFHRKDEKKRRRKKKSSGDIISVKSIGGDASSDISFEGLKNKWQQGEDGTQVLTFTTKEIRERKPELLNYIKRAGLVNVISEKLCQEKSSIKKLVKDTELSMRQSQDKLEQHRCLMAAVLTEILSVKEQLRDLQTALIDEESVCSKLRWDSKESSTQCSVAEKKVQILKNIITQAKQRGLGKASPVEASPVPEADAPPADNAATAMTAVTEVSDSTAQVVDTREMTNEAEDQDRSAADQPMEVDESKPEVEEVSVVIAEEQGAAVPDLVPQVGPTEPAPQQAVVVEEGPSVETVCPVETVQESVPQQQVPTPTTTTSTTPDAQNLVEVKQVDSTPTELTSEEQHQIVSVSIEGGHSLAHNVMLELPKDLLQCQPSSATNIDSLPSSTSAPVSVGVEVVEQDEEVGMANTQLQTVEIRGELEGVILKSDSPVHDTVTTTEVLSHPVERVVQVMEEVVSQTETVEVEQGLGPAVPDQHQIQQQQVQPLVPQTMQMTPGQSRSQPELIQDFGDLPVGLVSSGSSSTLPGVVVEGSELQGGVLPQPTLDTALKPDFDSIIMRPGDLGDVILQGTDVNSLPLQQDQSGGLVVQQSSLPLGVDSVGLNTLLTGQVDEGMLVQQDVASNFVIQQQGPPQALVQEKVMVQSAPSDNMFLQTSLSADGLLQPASSADVIVQPSSSQNMLVQQEGLQNIILQTEEAQNVMVQEQAPSAGPAQVVTEAPVVLQQQQGQDIVLPNLDFLQGLGQVQTIMIDGQAYQVILQPADST